MAEVYRFFNSLNGDRTYLAEDWARYFSMFLTNGVYHIDFNPTLTVSPNNNMTVNVAIGQALINGYMYENTTPKTLTVAAAETNLNRIDRVVVRLDRNQGVRTITTQILKGTPAPTPAPPALTRTSYIHEISLAQIRVNQGSATITAANIVDERKDALVCGLVRSLITEQFLLARDDSNYSEYKMGVENGMLYIQEV